jgi:hypothetical protein
MAMIPFFLTLHGCVSDYHMGVQRVGTALSLAAVSADLDNALQLFEDQILRDLIAGNLTRIQHRLAPALRARLGRDAWRALEQALVAYRLTGAWTRVRLASSNSLTVRQAFIHNRFEDYEYVEVRYKLAGSPGALIVLALTDVGGAIKITGLCMEAWETDASDKGLPHIQWVVLDRTNRP